MLNPPQKMTALSERMQVQQGNITQIQVDAVVNAANPSLLGGGGVDGAIHAAAGPELLEHCKGLGKCEFGGAKISPAFGLPAKDIVHCVGPMFHHHGNDAPILLQSTYQKALELALEYKCESIAFPNISTGAYAYPLKPAAKIAIETVSDFLQSNALPIRVVFVCFDKRNFKIYQTEFESRGLM